MPKITEARARKVQNSLSREISAKTVGNSIMKGGGGNYDVVLLLERRAPKGTSPAKIDGVKVTTKVIGRVRAL